MAKFSDVLKIINGKNQSKVENPNGIYPIYGSGGIMGYADSFLCKANTVVIGRKGNINKPIFVESPFWNVDTAFGLEANQNMLMPKYLYYFCEQYDFEKLNTTVTIPSLTKVNLLQIDIPLPPLIKQQEIVEKIDKVVDLISLRKKQLQKLDDLIKSRFAEMFGDVIDEDTLLNLCNIIDYRGKTPDKANAGLPFITAKNVKKHHLSLEPREYITKETYDKVMTRGFPREGDVIFTTEAPLGNMCRLPRFETEFYVGQRIVTLQTKKLNPAYLEYALDTTDFQTKLFEKSSGSTVTGIRVRLLEQLTIPVPSREGQDRFVAFVDAIEKNKRDVQQALDKLEQMKQALMQKYFG